MCEVCGDVHHAVHAWGMCGKTWTLLRVCMSCMLGETEQGKPIVEATKTALRAGDIPASIREKFAIPPASPVEPHAP